MGYLNKHEGDVLLAFAETFSELGSIKSKKNGWSGGSYVLEEAKIVSIDSQAMGLEVTVQERSKPAGVQAVSIDLDATPAVATTRKSKSEMMMKPVAPREDLDMHPVDDMIRRLNRLCWIVNKPKTTGRLIQMGIQIGGDGVGKIKDNMYLNQVPHNRFVRKYFYDMAADATLEAVTLCSQGELPSNRMQLVSMFPEMNPSMDSYR
jgi:hypothetical protein